MTVAEAARAFALGADVVSTECLLVRSDVTVPCLEIPVGSPGVVFKVPAAETCRGYGVVFWVRNTPVETDVTAGQIALDQRRAARGPVSPDMPPLIARDPYRRAPFVPTLRYPHQRCRLLHPVNAVLLGGLYLIVLIAVPSLMLVLTAVLVVAVYLYQFIQYREWSWVPLVFQFDTPGPGEKLVTDTRRVRRAAGYDVLFALSLGSVLGCHFFDAVSPYHLSAVVYIILLIATALSGIVRLTEHECAVRIVPENQERR